MPETTPQAGPSTRAVAASLRIIAAAIVIGCIYYASTIIITLICSIFIAFVLDPGVKWLERLRVPRWAGAMLMVLLMLGVISLGAYFLYDRAVALLDDLPHITANLKQLFAQFETTAKNIRQSTSGILSQPGEATIPSVRVEQESPWAQFLLRGLGSLYAAAVTVMFMPFLVFFMLTSKDQIWASTLNLFNVSKRHHVEEVLRGMSKMVREYVLGNLLVALISAAIMTPVFAWVGLEYALLMGPMASLLSLVPYIGVALAMLPPMLIALAEGTRLEPLLVIALTVVVVHFIAVNFLTPKLVGHRVKLNALTVTIAMMFWGWLWGGIGLVLAVPVTAALKAIFDNVRPLRPYGDWMGEPKEWSSERE
jgi:predicted PurR-regulated permease PerM